MENLDKLVNELRKLPTETQWLDFNTIIILRT